MRARNLENTNMPEDYDANRLLDLVIETLKLQNDAALSRALEVAPPVVSKIRHHRLPIGTSMILRIHDISRLPLDQIRKPLGKAYAPLAYKGARSSVAMA